MSRTLSSKLSFRVAGDVDLTPETLLDAPQGGARLRLD